MSQTARPLSELPLFAEPAPVRIVHDKAEGEHAAFLDRVRRILAGMYSGSGQHVTTDQAWDAMQKYGIGLPPGASPNLMGSLFSGWDRASAVGWTRSKRPGSNGNLLREWVVR